jgi:hypothetical protein
MAETSRFSDLIARLENASEPSIELDARIACALNDWPVPGGEHVHWPMLAQSQGARPWTYSLDEALTLAEEKLPKRGSDLLREAVSAFGKRHNMHITFHALNISELARDVLIAMFREIERTKATGREAE